MALDLEHGESMWSRTGNFVSGHLLPNILIVLGVTIVMGLVRTIFGFNPVAIEEDENLSLQEKEVEMIRKSLEKHKKRKLAAKELGISERTLYRKIKQYNFLPSYECHTTKLTEI